MTMMKFIRALNVAVACTGTEKFGNAQIVTIRKKIKIMLLIIDCNTVVRCIFASIGINLQYQFSVKILLHCEVVAPDGYMPQPAFYQDLVEFNNVSAGRTGRGNKNYLTFMKSSKTFEKIIFCKRLPQANNKAQKLNTFVALQR